eukprot:1877822-Rhodomonas_salina.1
MRPSGTQRCQQEGAERARAEALKEAVTAPTDCKPKFTVIKTQSDRSPATHSLCDVRFSHGTCRLQDNPQLDSSSLVLDVSRPIRAAGELSAAAPAFRGAPCSSGSLFNQVRSSGAAAGGEKGGSVEGWDVLYSGTGFNYDFGGLTSDTPYTFRLKTFNNKGDSEWCAGTFETRQVPVDDGGKGLVCLYARSSRAWVALTKCYGAINPVLCSMVLTRGYGARDTRGSKPLRTYSLPSRAGMPYATCLRACSAVPGTCLLYTSPSPRDRG